MSLPVLDRGRHRIWPPDFSLLTYGGLVVEYAGMPVIEDDMRGIRHKERAYRANGLEAVFLYPDGLQGPQWPEHVMAKIRSAQGSRYGSIR